MRKSPLFGSMLLSVLVLNGWGANAIASPDGLEAPLPWEEQLDLGFSAEEQGASPSDMGGFDCLISPDVVVEASIQVSGVLETVDVKVSDRVEEGQVLATLRSTVERAAVALARTRVAMESETKIARERLALRGRKLARGEELLKKKAISLNEVDELRSEKRLAGLEIVRAKENRELAERELDRAQETLNLRTLRSPISGLVVEKFKSAGEFVQSEPVVRLAKLDPLRVEVILPVAMLGRINLDDLAEVMPEAPVSGVYQAKVIGLDHVIDAASGTFGVRLELPNPHYALPGGLKCDIRFLGPPPPSPLGEEELSEEEFREQEPRDDDIRNGEEIPEE
uniref:RND family efflux transporter, MFP subunit n=1 Tax=Candidatus Kentrum sp. DK TaxID=2126562 RepID=A0A450S112_9GAMM|nr:MAG: RND family efflux transporter, MFP subunit [Candidatus Kentron sp. DK]